MRYALLVEYDGTGFHGSQLQNGVRTVQGELEASLAEIYGRAVRVSLAGRTDAGVHAKGQVAAFNAEDRHSTDTLREALNYHLDEDVAVRAAKAVGEEFDPRRHALEREYIFSLNHGPSRSPLNRLYEVKTRELNSLSDMKSAAEAFAGSHDFASFAGPLTPPDATTIRHVASVNVVEADRHRAQVVVRGNAFLHQQVRRMTGALVRVGTGKMRAEELADLVDRPRRGAAGWPLQPQGLCLGRIEYGKNGPFVAETEYN